MKKSFVAMVLILALCLSQFLIGNAEGKAIDITDTVAIPSYDDSGAYTAEKVEGGLKVAGTSAKEEYSCVMGAIEGNVKEYTKIKVVLEGKAGTVVMLKLEQGGIPKPLESERYTLVDGEQVIEWVVDATYLTETGGEKFVIFVNPGTKGATDPVVIKSVKLCTPDYVEPVEPTPAPETGDSFNMVPAMMMVLAAFVFVVAYAKKREMI